MNRRGVAALVVALLLSAGCSPESGDEGAEAGVDEAAPGTAGDATTESENVESEDGGELEPLSNLPVTLYFPSAFSDGLVPEPAEIFNTASPVDRAKQIISDLVSGPNEFYALRCLPPHTRLRQVYVTEDGVAWADFSSGLGTMLGGGSARELLAIYALVDSLALNIPEIRRVGILIDGEPVDTLTGHVDLRRPLPADESLIREPPTEEEWDEAQVVGLLDVRATE